MTGAAFAPPLVDHRPVRRPGIGRLTAVEMRKMVDTRSGAWLVGVVAALTAVMVAIGLFAGSDENRSFGSFFELTLYPVGLLLPVLGILMVTTEWSQRTALTTFALVPERGRVALAKFLAAAIYALLSLVPSLVAAAVGNVLVTALDRGAGSWTFAASAVGSAALFQVIGAVMGVAFGMLLMNSPLAIVAYFALPLVWSILGAAVPRIQEAAVWLDLNVAAEPLATDTMTGAGWAHLTTAVGFWVLLPTVLGVLRLLRREVA